MEKFELFIQQIKEAELNVHGVHLYQRGEKDIEFLFHKNEDYPIYSVTKAFVSAIFGIAQKEGFLSIHDSIAKYLESEFFDHMATQQKENFKTLPLERFLTMSVMNFPFRLQGDNWYEYVSGLRIDYGKEPGFCYSNISAYLIGVAVENAIGRPLVEYMKEKLFDPLEIPLPEYMKDPYGHFYGASGMRLKLQELSRFARLYLQGGKYDQKTIIPVKWVQDSCSLQINCKEGGYGYFIWKYENGYRMSGKWGQRAIILPERHMVLTYLSDLQENDQSKKMDALAKIFIRA